MARAGVDSRNPRPASWFHGSEAEPLGASAPAQEASATPSVLTKLQKWVRYLRGGLGRGLVCFAAYGRECPFSGKGRTTLPGRPRAFVA